MRVNIVVAVGAMGEKADLERFAALMEADFGVRCQRAASQIFNDRITILPMPEVISAPEDENDSRGSGSGVQGEVRGGGEGLHEVGPELPSEETEQEDEPGYGYWEAGDY